MELFRFIRYNREDVVSLKCFVQLNKKKPAFYDIHTLSARNPKLEAEERTRRRPFVNQQKWWKKRKEATREETFQKTARQLRILAGFGSQGSACESSNPCGIIITEKKEKEESKGGGEKRADQSARYLTNTGVCWPPLLPRTNRETIRRIFFFFFFTHARRESRVRHRRSELPEKRSHASLKTLKPLLRLPSFPPFPPFVLMNGNRSVGFRVCAPLVAHRSHEEGG